MPGIKVAVIVVAIIILVVVPLLLRETYRLNKHVKPDKRAEQRAKTTE